MEGRETKREKNNWRGGGSRPDPSPLLHFLLLAGPKSVDLIIDAPRLRRAVWYLLMFTELRLRSQNLCHVNCELMPLNLDFLETSKYDCNSYINWRVYTDVVITVILDFEESGFDLINHK